MPSPLPLALRRRVVEAYNNGEGTYRELAERFQIGEASVSRWLRLDREEDDLAPKTKGPTPHTRKLQPEHLAFLEDTIEVLPTSTAPELVAALEEEFDLEVSEATVRRARRGLGFTPKKGTPSRSSELGKT